MAGGAGGLAGAAVGGLGFVAWFFAAGSFVGAVVSSIILVGAVLGGARLAAMPWW